MTGSQVRVLFLYENVSPESLVLDTWSRVEGDILIGGKNGEYEFVASSTLGSLSPVQSVFGRTGAITAQTGDYTTSQVTEGSNLYFTNARAVAALTGQNVSIFTNDAGYLTTSVFNTDFDTRLSSTTSLPKITTLSGLSLPYSQLTGTPNLTAYLTLASWFATTSAPQLTNLPNLSLP